MLSVEEMKVFSTFQRCSLGIDRIGPVLDKVKLQPVLSRLTCLEISLSHSVRPKDKQHVNSNSGAGVEHAKDVAKFLHLCPRITSLDLHWFKLMLKPESQDDEEESRFFDHIARMDNFSLHHLRLLGITTDENTLLAFSERNRDLESLEMDFVHLTSGKFKKFFDHIVAHCVNLNYVRLDDLHESREIFFGKGTPHRITSNKNDGVNELERRGTAARKRIWYRVAKGYHKGSAQSNNWDNRQYRLYGPPDFMITK